MNKESIDIKDLEPENIDTVEDGEALERENAENFGEPVKE